MEDLMGKLQEMLSDEESMNQIKQLAEMLGGAEASDGGNENEEAPKPQESDGARTETFLLTSECFFSFKDFYSRFPQRIRIPPCFLH